jgi:hypothetical protein
MSENKNYSGTLMIVPFRLGSSKKNLQSDIRSQLIEVCHKNTAQLKELKVYNSTHYPDFIKYHLADGRKYEADPYLKFYRLTKDPDVLSSGNCYILTNDEIKINFKIKEIQLVLNENAQISDIGLGYWIIYFEWMHDDSSFVLKALSNTSFFRYHNFDQKKKDRDFVFYPNDEKITIRQWIKDHFQDFDWSNLYFYQDKSTLLHLINSQNMNCDSEESRMTKKNNAYKALRIPPKNWTYGTNADEMKLLNLKIISLGSEVLALDEGTIIIEPITNSLQDNANKYFPAFILALNQREVVHLMINRIAEVFSDRNNMADFQHLNLQELKTLLIKTKHYQIFHTISKNSEINLFFHELQKTFLIDEGLRDVQESIQEMNELFADDERRANENERKAKELEREVQEERQNKLNYVLALIAFLGIFSAFNDTYDLFGIKETWNPNLVWLAILLIVSFMSYSILKTRKNR